MSQSDLAKAVGVSKQTIFVMEKNNYSPSLLLAYRIADFFGVSVEEIFTYKKEEAKMITNLDVWLGESSNFNLFVGIITSIGIISAIIYTYSLSKIGKIDEYSLQIRLNVTNKMFITLMLLFIIFVLFVPSDVVYMKQIIYMFFAITALVGAVSAAYYYYRDFKR